MIDKSAKIVLTGAAGLVGQNLIVELKAQGYTHLVAIDKHEYNLGILRRDEIRSSPVADCSRRCRSSVTPSGVGKSGR